MSTESLGAVARRAELEDGSRRLAESGAEGFRYVSPDLSAPAAVTARLEEIERELAEKQNALEDAAFAWFQQKRMRERDHAAAFLGAAGSVAERTAIADQTVGANHEAILAEARYEAMKAKVRVLETRASIGQSILRSQSRA